MITDFGYDKASIRRLKCVWKYSQNVWRKILFIC